MDQNKKIDRQLDEISKKISFSAVNPANELAEKRKFFKNKGYNPQFIYEPYRENLGLLKKRLSALKPDRSVVGSLLDSIRKNYLLDISMLSKRGDESFTKAALKIYSRPSEKLLRKARELVKLKVTRERKIYSGSEIISRIRLSFLKYGVDWSVEEKNILSLAAVKVADKKLIIRKNSKFSKNFLKRIIVHEIGTHIMRAENGSMQPYLFFSRGLPGYLMTEEGLAVINEEMNSCLNNFILKVYAGRVLAVNMALKESFHSTYTYMRQFFEKDTAWRITVRAKRGLGDTGMPGGCSKDIAYLKGYLAIKDFLRKGGDIHKLYYGKVGLSHVELLSKIPDLTHPAFMPMFRYSRFMLSHFQDLLKNLIFLQEMPRLNNGLLRSLKLLK